MKTMAAYRKYEDMGGAGRRDIAAWWLAWAKKASWRRVEARRRKARFLLVETMKNGNLLLVT